MIRTLTIPVKNLPVEVDGVLNFAVKIRGTEVSQMGCAQPVNELTIVLEKDVHEDQVQVELIAPDGVRHVIKQADNGDRGRPSTGNRSGGSDQKAPVAKEVKRGRSKPDTDTDPDDGFSSIVGTTVLA